ncbi:MAG: GntR family transcriptional regulator, partial [Alphaproteobacteria bacterium]|nr:GntR family transcriptional regulator [Alphaproteobacteria bacterium]
ELLIQQGCESTFENLFRGLIADSRSPLAEPLPAQYVDAPIRNRALNAFVEAVDALGAVTCDEHHQDRARDSAGSELVKLTQDYLVGEMRRLHADGLDKLGNETQIAERMGVSRQVLRQAMRLLEEQGLLACRRGRSNGIVAPATHPASLVGSITAAFKRDKLSDGEFRPVLSIVDRTNRCLFACKAEAAHFSALEKCALTKVWWNSATHVRRLHIEWPVIDNPVLTLLEQTLAAYRASRVGERITIAIADIVPLQRNTGRHIALMREGDLIGADQVYMTMQRQITELLGEY